MLYVKIFGEDGRHLGCCPESDSDDDDVHPSDDDNRRGGCILGGELALGDGRDASGSCGSPSGESMSEDD